MRSLIIIAFITCLSSNALAQEFRIPGVDNKRAGKWDVVFQINYQPEQDYGDTINGDGVNLELSHRTGFGFGLARNFGEHFALGGEFSWTSPRYELNTVNDDGDPINVENRADIVSIMLKGTLNLLSTPFTPYVDIGGGWTNVDSNIASSQPVCWWDPWWGWVCSSSSFNESNFSYSGAAGFRWDIGSRLLLKMSYNRLFIDTRNTPAYDTIRLEIGTSY